jgi:hypothetical protein
MGEENVSVDFDRLLSDLARLQNRWERKLIMPQQHGRKIWALGVLFGIEIGRARITEANRKPLGELKALLSEWERIKSHTEATIGGASLDKETIQGLDFGIRLVIRRVHRSLNRGFDEN